jgi:putative redox protein
MSDVTVKWLELKRFVAIDPTNHTTVISGTEEDGKIGIKPVDLLLMSLGSCMAMSIVYVLQQKRQKLDDFEVFVSGKMKPDAPWTFTDFHMKYTFWGSELSEKAVVDAIRIGTEQLCGVTDLLSKCAAITDEYVIHKSKDKLPEPKRN